MAARFIVIPPTGKGLVVSLATDYKYISEYGETEVAEELWRKLNHLSSDDTIGSYTHVRTKVEEIIELRGTERDILFYCAGKYGEIEVLTEAEYQIKLDKEYEELHIGEEFIEQYEARMARGPEPVPGE